MIATKLFEFIRIIIAMDDMHDQVNKNHIELVIPEYFVFSTKGGELMV